MEEQQALVKIEPQENRLVLSPVMDIEVAKANLAKFQEFIKGYLREGEDFGTIPGTPKPTLLKPGADKLCEIYGLTDTYEITNRVEDWDRGLFDYEIRCTLSKRDGTKWAEGIGSCNSFEGRYRWRDAKRKCPNCGGESIVKGKPEYIKKDGSGYWLCYAKKGGCGALFKMGDQLIESQEIGKVLNEDIATQKNTILKMAKKRAKIDATLAATRSSGVFTQDMEDIAQNTPQSRQDAPGSIEGELVITDADIGPPATDETFDKHHGNEPSSKTMFSNAYSHEIEAKTKRLEELLLSPDITEHERDQMWVLKAKVKTLEDITKLVRHTEDILKKRAKDRAEIDKANSKAQNKTLMEQMGGANAAF